MKNGMSVQYGIELFPRMRLKRDVIFGFVDLWGELLSGILLLVSSNLILSLEGAHSNGGQEGCSPHLPLNRNQLKTRIL
jgi:hypothetical protein